MLTTDLVVAMGILVLAIVPLSFSFLNEQKLCRAYYQRSVAMEIVDGEMEKLVAGEWRQQSSGRHEYSVKAEAAKQLEGKFYLNLAGKDLLLEFQPKGIQKGGHVMREAKTK